MRADARRNREAIVSAALELLASDPEASIGAIASRAGVGRVTVYGHFCTRAELIDAVFESALAASERTLSELGCAVDPRTALAELIAATWRIVGRTRGLLLAARDHLPAERVRELHRLPLERVRSLLHRGRSEGVFRTDLSEDWLIAVYYNVVHGAVEEVAAGRLEERDAADAITRVVDSAFAPA
ncbi:TetR/AcrR family transcriptional regulator [Hoyosella subflava]|uniref:Transcriptional regulator, TetR family n=1 Tax=Hoyosella subflava (strain DSM 45089 / JCM 17490 / NBRC 109087 / DQS3-9A1) TaxID=443218 RepID=F6EJH6_HOYSD|nr:TetR family transcriptional regulator [Hoyosella subflava]AEF39025.1 Transcriptional regulator, TetR family [Hoyosella subflava DQS3-9A1]